MKKMSVTTMVYLGVLAALNIVLARLVSIPVGGTLRISVSSTPTMLAGLWFGPLCGGLVGLVGDLIGCMISGYAPNPFITCSAILTGLIPGLLASLTTIRAAEGRLPDEVRSLLRYLPYLAIVAATMLITSQGLTTFGLAFMYGSPFWPMFLSRLPQSCFLLIINSILVCLMHTRIRLPGLTGHPARS